MESKPEWLQRFEKQRVKSTNLNIDEDSKLTKDQLIWKYALLGINIEAFEIKDEPKLIENGK